MLNSIIEAFLLGLVGGATPGPILTGTFAEILRFNFVNGLKIVFQALIIETIGALLVLYIFFITGFSHTAIQIISICGAVVLFWIASSMWKIKKINTETKEVLSLSKIILLTAFNSGYWIFWIAVGIPKALAFDKQIIKGKLLYLIIFEIGWLFMTVLLAFVFYKFRPVLQRKNLVGTTFKILAIILILLGIKTLLNAF